MRMTRDDAMLEASRLLSVEGREENEMYDVILPRDVSMLVRPGDVLPDGWLVVRIDLQHMKAKRISK